METFSQCVSGGLRYHRPFTRRCFDYIATGGRPDSEVHVHCAPIAVVFVGLCMCTWFRPGREMPRNSNDFKWTDDETELFLTVTHECKAQKTWTGNQ